MFNVINKIRNTSKKYKKVTICVAIVFLWFISGVFLSGNKALVKVNDNNIKPSVTTSEVVLEDKLIVLKLTGTVNAHNDIIVMPEASGIIESVNVKKGDFIKKGDVIASIEINDKQVQLEKAQAVFKQRQLDYEVTESLNNAGYSSEAALAASLALLKAAESDVKIAEINFGNCNIRSPLNGIINNINIKKGVVVNNTTNIANIINCSEYFISTNIPEKSISKLEANYAEVTFTKFAHSLKGYIDGVSMKSNPSTHSYNIEIKIPEMEEKCMNIVGMIADVNLSLYKTKSYKIPAYALSLSDDGYVGIKTLDKENIAHFYKVEVLEEDEKGDFWVKTLLPIEDNITLITTGHNYVQVGQSVNVDKNVKQHHV